MAEVGRRTFFSASMVVGLDPAIGPDRTALVGVSLHRQVELGRATGKLVGREAFIEYLAQTLVEEVCCEADEEAIEEDRKGIIDRASLGTELPSEELSDRAEDNQSLDYNDRTGVA